MSKFHKVNSYTWVKTDRPDAWQKKADEGTYRELQKAEHKPVVRNDYQNFVFEIFEDRKYISQSDLYKLIKKRFGKNTTYYCRMMLKLELMTERNKLFKLNKKWKSQKSPSPEKR